MKEGTSSTTQNGDALVTDKEASTGNQTVAQALRRILAKMMQKERMLLSLEMAMLGRIATVGRRTQICAIAICC